MNKELIINSSEGDVQIALLEDKKLVELHKDNDNNEFGVGDIYLGRVKKINAGLNATFVNVGYEKDGFLHYFDLSPQYKNIQKWAKAAISGKANTSKLDNFDLSDEIDKGGKINSVLKSGQEVIVQVAKEPISAKGPRLCCELSLAGRFLVLVPFSNKISVSQKIKDKEERSRLRNLMTSILPKNFGVIVRTVAVNKKVAELDSDLRNLVERWDDIFINLKGSKAPKRILGELTKSHAILRDLLNPSFNKIHVDDLELFTQMKAYLKSIAPDRVDILKQYKGNIPIMDAFNVSKQIKASFGRHVSMDSGAYLIVEHTEALHVVDVNSGNTTVPTENQEENALKVNVESAKEIARQLRLRDMGGIVVVDFIDMRQSENRKELVRALKEFMSLDKAKHQILPPSKFGLVQITRQRVRPEMEIDTTEIIPVATGTKEVQATILLIDEIEKRVRMIMEQLKPGNLTIKLHPFIDAYLKKNFRKFQRNWFAKHKVWVKIIPHTNYPLMQIKFFIKGEEVEF